MRFAYVTPARFEWSGFRWNEGSWLRSGLSRAASSTRSFEPTSGRAISTKAILPRSQATKFGTPCAVLARESFGTGPVQDRPEPPDLGAADAGAVVDHQAGDRLRGALAEHPALGLVDRRSLHPRRCAGPGPSGSRLALQARRRPRRSGRRHSGCKSGRASRRGRRAACRAGARPGSRGRGWCRPPAAGRGARWPRDRSRRRRRPCGAGTRCRAEPGSWPRPANNRAAGRRSGPGESRCSGKNAFQVHVHDDRAAAVRGGVGEDAPARDEAVGGRLDRQLARRSPRRSSAGLRRGCGAGRSSVRVPPLFLGTVNWT